MLTASIILTLLLLTVLLGKKNKLRADKFLLLYLSGSVLQQVYSYVELTGLLDHSDWMLLGKGGYLIVVPLFFLYVHGLTQERSLSRRYYGLIFSPAIIFSCTFFYYHFIGFSSHSISIHYGFLYLDGQVSWPWALLSILLLVIEPAFLIAFYFFLRDYKSRMLQNVSSLDRIKLDWLNVLFYIWLFSALILVPAGIFSIGFRGMSTDVISMMVAVLNLICIFMMGYFGFRQTAVFTNLAFADRRGDRDKRISYERSGLTPGQSKMLHGKLVALMNEQHPYLDGELTSRDLAEQLGISTHHLSQILTQEQQQNFFDFVNTYRVEAAKKKMRDPANSHLTLLAMALDSGFNSKTSFNTLFKKFTSMTPSEYYKSIPPPETSGIRQKEGSNL
jgi:AraC-like DNA-binding protein